jgi:hypothetical protein
LSKKKFLKIHLFTTKSNAEHSTEPNVKIQNQNLSGDSAPDCAESLLQMANDAIP